MDRAAASEEEDTTRANPAIARSGAALEEGRRVFYDAAEGEDMSLVRSCLLGPVAAGMMRQRGYLPLHASAVAPGPKAPVVAMLGWCGWGKSSTAAAL